MEPLLSVEDAARLLSLSPWTVRAKIREGKLSPVRLGRRVLLEQSELQRLIEEARARVQPSACGMDNRVVRLYEEQFSSGDLLMRWSKRCITAILLAGTPLLAQTSASSSAVNSSAVSAAEEPAKTAASPLALGSVEILTDTQGINFDSYLSRVLQDVRQQWFERIQEPPRTKRGNVVLDFAILEDGSVAGLRIIKTSGDVALDIPARGSISASNPFLPFVK